MLEVLEMFTIGLPLTHRRSRLRGAAQVLCWTAAGLHLLY